MGWGAGILPRPLETPVDRWVGWGLIPSPCAPARFSSHYWGSSTPGLLSFTVSPASRGGGGASLPPLGMGRVSAAGACTDARGSTYSVCLWCPHTAHTSWPPTHHQRMGVDGALGPPAPRRSILPLAMWRPLFERARAVHAGACRLRDVAQCACADTSISRPHT